MNKQIFSAIKVSALAIVLSFGMSYALAWTAPTGTPPTGSVSAPLNTGGTAQTKTGGLNIATGSGNVGIGTIAPGAQLHIGKPEVPSPAPGTVTRMAIQPYGHTGGPWYFKARDTASKAFVDIVYGANTTGLTQDSDGNVGIGTTLPVAKLDVVGTIKTTGGLVGNGPLPLGFHYVNRSEDSYGAEGGYYRYCNGFYNHDTCNGDYNTYYSCGKSANIASCVDAFPTFGYPRTDWGWCGSYFRDRTVSCRVNEVLSTYDDNI